MTTIICEVTRCEECPFFSVDFDDSENCSREGAPESRYAIGGWEEGVPKQIKDIPDDCPLLKKNK